jgi:hypothetical protein
MFPANPKPQLSQKEFTEKLIRLKPHFDKLTDYKAKLEFWDKNGFDIGVTTYGISDEKDKRDLPENNISIYPEIADEIKTYKRFYHTLFHNYNFNTLDTSIDKYWKKIEQGADPIPHTKNIIAEIDKEYKANNKFPDTGLNNLRSYCNGYDASQNGQIEDFLNNSSFHNSLLSFFTGEVHEQYRRFLVKQLKQLEGGKPAMLDAQEKLHISVRLLGDNKSNTSQLDYYHIPYILNYFDITPKEAREILLFSKGAFTPKMSNDILEKIVAHLERVYPEILIDKPQQKELENKIPNPLKNYRDFYWQFEAFFDNCRWNYRINNPDKINAFCDKLTDAEIYNISHRAKQEIENLVFSPNNSTAYILIESINNDRIVLGKVLKSIIDDNNLSNVEVMPKNFHFFDAAQNFHEFYDWFTIKFKKLIPLETEINIENTKQPLNLSGITNNFDSVKIEDVFSHFENSLVEKKYLTESDLLSYLKVAFGQIEVPETLFRFNNAPTKSKIIKVFNEYYKNVAGKPHGKQKKYAALLGNYFVGFTTENVSSNFTK